MATTLHMQGGDIEVDESFNLVRQRLNNAAKLVIDYREQGNDALPNGAKFEPFHTLSFKTVEGGRIAVNPDKVIAVSSDQAKDTGGEE
jgi:hypothetical protein